MTVNYHNICNSDFHIDNHGIRENEIHTRLLSVQGGTANLYVTILKQYCSYLLIKVQVHKTKSKVPIAF